MTIVRKIIQKKKITVSEDHDVRYICRLLTKSKLSGVPVVNKKGSLVGFVSEKDIIASVTRPRFLEKCAKDLMKRKVKTVGPEDHLMKASRIFSEEEFRILPVVKNGKVMGIITRKDVMEHMLKKCY